MEETRNPISIDAQQAKSGLKDIWGGGGGEIPSPPPPPSLCLSSAVTEKRTREQTARWGAGRKESGPMAIVHKGSGPIALSPSGLAFLLCLSCVSLSNKGEKGMVFWVSRVTTKSESQYRPDCVRVVGGGGGGRNGNAQGRKTTTGMESVPFAYEGGRGQARVESWSGPRQTTSTQWTSAPQTVQKKKSPHVSRKWAREKRE